MTSDDTPARLVAAAERLFVEGGEEATSLRAITREAISNAAAVHYHFGGRDGLLRAVLDRHLAGRQERRLRLLDKAGTVRRRSRPTCSPRSLRPDLELLASCASTGSNVARFLGRASAHRSPAVADYLDRQFADLADRAVPLLAGAVPGVSPADLRLRLRLVLDGCDALRDARPTAATGPAWHRRCRRAGPASWWRSRRRRRRTQRGRPADAGLKERRTASA